MATYRGNTRHRDREGGPKVADGGMANYGLWRVSSVPLPKKRQETEKGLKARPICDPTTGPAPRRPTQPRHYIVCTP